MNSSNNNNNNQNNSQEDEIASISSSSFSHLNDQQQLRDERTLCDSYLNILGAIGEDANREGLRKTPERAAKALLHFTKGYREDLDGLNSYSTYFRVFPKSSCHLNIFSFKLLQI